MADYKDLPALSKAENGEFPQRVFGIGLPKTGTTTLGTCLEHLGYRVKGFDIDALASVTKEDYSAAIERLTGFNACRDLPWFMIYKLLDERFPNSLFILTERYSPEHWLKSAVSHHSRVNNDQSSWITDCFEQHFYKKGVRPGEGIEMYTYHSADVRNYFADRKSSFRVLNWERGDAWPELCDFLGIDEYPDIPFPHDNRATTPQVSSSRVGRFRDILRKLKRKN
jgi:hypothetical protein